MNFRELLVATAAMSAAALAHAGRPLQTEDAGVLADGAWELESAHTRLTIGTGRASETTVQLGRGIGWQSQVAVAVGHGRAEGVRARSTALVGKTELWSNGRPDGASALTLAWGLSWLTAAGDARRHASTDLNLVYSRPLDHGLTVHANLGHTRDEIGRSRSTAWAFALEHDGFAIGEGRLAPLAEVFGDDRGSRWWNTGLRWMIKADKVWLDASYGREFASPSARLATAGLKFAF